MKKLYALIPMLLLAACAEPMCGDGTCRDDVLFDEETDRFAAGENEIEIQRPAYSDKRFGYAEEGIPMPAKRNPEPMLSAKLSADGTMIELPAQQIYIGDPSVPGAIVSAGTQPISYSEPMTETWAPREEQPQRPTPAPVVTLQNIAYPNTYAQCTAADTACITAYEQQGYRRVSGLPQFAGYQDTLAPSDYPENGQWRNGNNIPRW